MPESQDDRLLRADGVMVGRGACHHPQKEGFVANVAVYRTHYHWVVCVSEVAADCPESVGQRELGRGVPHRLFAPYVTREIEGDQSYAEVRRMLDESLPRCLPGLRMTWLQVAEPRGGSGR